MPRKRKRLDKPEEPHTHLALRVAQYEASVNASVNHHVYAPQYAWDLDESDPLYQFTAQLTITAISTSPKERAGETYELTIYGDDAPSRRHHATLKDAQARDQFGSPRYRQYRGKRIPMFNPPKGMGLIDKVRGEPRWATWLFVPVRSVNDMLELLSRERGLFVAMHERKESRARWLQSLTLQTIDPMEE